jgi:glutaredoxin
MEKITIYTNETCPYCKQVKDELTKNNIEFEERLTDKWLVDWQGVVNLTGMATVPTINYGNEFFVPNRDFQNAQQLPTIFKNFNQSKFSESKQILEKIKTLNLNITMAFGRVDQLLKQIETNTKKE